ncbi:hypothetical protein CEXT_320091 [Caerostris extrusa]|uniref:Secreted protein n=1 Tax=Caerostris extrusa TaxID=172846 RepID=A0AAV4X090_CAEEX|nr:hypothetical protein CEXT_320091 [Caerostris extrusa]
MSIERCLLLLFRLKALLLECLIPNSIQMGSIQFRNAKPSWLSPNPSSPNRTCGFSGPDSLEHLDQRRQLVPFKLGQCDYGVIF